MTLQALQEMEQLRATINSLQDALTEARCLADNQQGTIVTLRAELEDMYNIGHRQGEKEFREDMQRALDSL